MKKIRTKTKFLSLKVMKVRRDLSMVISMDKAASIAITTQIRKTSLRQKEPKKI